MFSYFVYPAFDFFLRHVKAIPPPLGLLLQNSFDLSLCESWKSLCIAAVTVLIFDVMRVRAVITLPILVDFDVDLVPILFTRSTHARLVSSVIRADLVDTREFTSSPV